MMWDGRVVAFGVWLIAWLSIAGCARGIPARTTGWVMVETEDLRFRTDLDRDRAVKLARKYQRIRDALADNEFPCAFERANAPMEFVILREQEDIDAVGLPYQAGLFIPAPSALIDAKSQALMSSRYAGKRTSLFAHELTHTLMATCFPDAPIWLIEGMASFYETIKIEGDEVVLGTPAYGFLAMQNVEPMHDIYEVMVRGVRITILPKRLVPDFDELKMLEAEEFYRHRDGGRTVSDHRQRTAHYAGSWLAVHLLQFGHPTLSQRFPAYLRALSQGMDDRDAWRTAFGVRDVAGPYQDYVTAEYPIARRPINLPSIGEPLVTEMSTADAALLWATLYGWYREEDAARAEPYINYALEQEPESAAALLYGAALRRDLERPDAEEWLRRAQEAAPHDPDVLASSLIWHFTGADDPSVERLRPLAERLSESAHTCFQYTQLAEYALLVGDPMEALGYASRAIALDATHWRPYAIAGEAYHALGEQEQARRAYLTAIGLTGHGTSASLRESLRERLVEMEGSS